MKPTIILAALPLLLAPLAAHATGLPAPLQAVLDAEVITEGVCSTTNAWEYPVGEGVVFAVVRCVDRYHGVVDVIVRYRADGSRTAQRYRLWRGISEHLEIDPAPRELPWVEVGR